MDHTPVYRKVEDLCQRLEDNGFDDKSLEVILKFHEIMGRYDQAAFLKPGKL